MTAIGRPLSLALLVGVITFTATTFIPGARPGPAWAQPAEKPGAPTPAQLEEAKRAFKDGKDLFDAKKFELAAEKFKESFRLSRNPVLLYNVAFTFDSMGRADLAFFYYKKFLSDAPKAAGQRKDATARASILEKELAAAPDVPEDSAATPDPAPGSTAEAGDPATSTGTAAENPTASPGPTDPATNPTSNPTDVAKPKRVVDPSSYTAADFKHQILEDAPPGKPLDLTAFSPPDSGWIVTLFYRGYGEGKFHAVPMKPRYNELVGRVPAKKLTGVSIQYYIEVRTPDAKIVTRIGKPASPNIIYLDDAAQARYYPDLEDSIEIGNAEEVPGGDVVVGDSGRSDYVPGGYTDVGSTKFKRAKWIATGTGIGMLGVSVTFYLMAASMSSSLEAEAALANDTGECGADVKPCRRFNDDRKAVELAGSRNELVSRITFGLGLAVTGAAGYLWYQEIRAAKRGETATARRKTGLGSMVAAPLVGAGFVGGTAAVRF